MTTIQNDITCTISSSDSAYAQVSQQRLNKLESRHFWFFFGVAPLAVMGGWSLVGLCLAGDWAWEFPLGILFSMIGSMAALVSSLVKPL